MKFQVGDNEIYLVHVKKEILDIEAGTLADGYELRRLEMRIAEGRHASVFHCEAAQGFYDRSKLAADVDKGITIDHEVCIIRHITARCAEMDYPRCVRAAFAVDMDMRHDIVAQLLFLCGNGVIIYLVIHMRFKLRDLFCGHGEAELMLRACKSDPEPAPCAVTSIGREELQHVFGCIA